MTSLVVSYPPCKHSLAQMDTDREGIVCIFPACLETQSGRNSCDCCSGNGRLFAVAVATDKTPDVGG